MHWRRGAKDALISATAPVYDLTVITGSAADFQPSVKDALNPWI